MTESILVTGSTENIGGEIKAAFEFYEWHANVIVELLRITRDGYVSGFLLQLKK